MKINVLNWALRFTLGRAQVVIAPQNTSVVAGNTIVMACVGSGSPTPSLNWSRNGMELTNDSRFTIYNELVTENGVTFIESILEICSIGEADAGEYTCAVANQAGADTVTVQVTVTGSGGECNTYFEIYLCYSNN